MKNIYQLADAHGTTWDTIIDIYDAAQTKLQDYAEANGYDCTIIVFDGEVYLEGNESDWFESEAQCLFDNYLSEMLENLSKTPQARQNYQL